MRALSVQFAHASRIYLCSFLVGSFLISVIGRNQRLELCEEVTFSFSCGYLLAGDRFVPSTVYWYNRFSNDRIELDVDNS